ncbi:hypothetical protein C8Q79DRAFT_918199 [Trametes meyenii]|nr:hypothetical protein C8Q79DRAFT_918199 [Trametes meyenii]
MSAPASTNLYELLGVRKDATSQEVRQAYRRRALQTHPDRLPQDVSAADKKAAEEQFRLVNNAYEVLNNEENRKLYDKHGVWPPPAERPDYPRRPSRDQFSQNPFFNDPFFQTPFGSGARAERGFAFTDPFELFNSLFGDLHNAFDNDPFFSGTPFVHAPFNDPFFRSPFDNDPVFRSAFGGSPFGNSMFGGSPFGALMGDAMFPQIEGGSSSRVYSSRTEAVGQNGQWVSRSQMTRTVNGRTETITKRVDASGNEHITYASPEGERYTINGVEQPTHSNRPVEGPRPSETAPPRQPPRAIADTPAQRAEDYVLRQQPQPCNIPVSGPTQTPAPAASANAYPVRARSHRSHHSGHSDHRDRLSAEDGPRRSYTTPAPPRGSFPPPYPPTDPRMTGHNRVDVDAAPVAPVIPGQHIRGGRDRTESARHASLDNGQALMRDPRRDSAQSARSYRSHHDLHTGDSVRDRTSHRSSRHESRDYARSYPRERDFGSGAEARDTGAGPVLPEQPRGHSQRGWRGW